MKTKGGCEGYNSGKLKEKSGVIGERKASELVLLLSFFMLFYSKNVLKFVI